MTDAATDVAASPAPVKPQTHLALDWDEQGGTTLTIDGRTYRFLAEDKLDAFTEWMLGFPIRAALVLEIGDDQDLVQIAGPPADDARLVFAPMSPERRARLEAQRRAIEGAPLLCHGGD